MHHRIEKVREYIEKNSLDCVVVSSYENYRYFSGFNGSNCRLVISPFECFLITDGRYETQAEVQTRGFEILIQERAGSELLTEVLKKHGFSRVGYESKALSDYEATTLKRDAPRIDWTPLAGFAEDIRIVKDKEEIENIRRAAEIADKAFNELLPVLRPGITERKVAAELEYRLSMSGSEKPAFETIVASGERGALPHGLPSDKKLCENEMVTLDFGACYNGYMSDITRTVWLGSPPEKLIDVWNAVYEAQRESKAAVRAGLSCRELDAVHRAVFEKHGLSGYIRHSLGHGVGLAIHEEPRISRNSDVTLRENMVITIEPGLYLPGLGGVRTEDMVLVTENGYRQLTQSGHLIKI